MCGITGYISKNKIGADKAKTHLSNLLIQSMSRGVDATGIGFIEKNELYVVKKNLPANEFIKTDVFNEVIANHHPKIMLGHTRAATLGDASKNVNNHPLFTLDGSALIHNGVISNYDTLFEEYKLKREAQVDSEIILKLIKHFKKESTTIEAIIKTASVVRGSMAIAYIENDDTLYLAASSNPIELAYEKPTGNIYFASRLEYLKSSLIDNEMLLGFFETSNNKDDYLFESVNDDTALVITSDNIKTYKIERPKYQWSWDRQDQSSHTQTHLTLVTGNSKVNKNKNQVSEWSTFDPRSPIYKPSRFLTYQLEERLEMVEYLLTLKNHSPKLDEEKRRLENALMDRYAEIDNYYDD